MGELLDDVVQFIEQRFARKDVQIVYGLLGNEELTPRVMRAVLYLSDGNLSLLKHYVTECTVHVGEILANAECTIGVVEPLRDLSLPFDHERNLGEGRTDKQGQHRRKPQRATAKARYNQHLAGRRFRLGDAVYMIANRQAHPIYVRCYRTTGTVSSIVTLPLLFVLEQLAERIELDTRNGPDHERIERLDQQLVSLTTRPTAVN